MILMFCDMIRDMCEIEFSSTVIIYIPINEIHPYFNYLKEESAFQSNRKRSDLFYLFHFKYPSIKSFERVLINYFFSSSAFKWHFFLIE